MACAGIPDRDCDGERHDGDDGDVDEIFGCCRAAEHANAWIVRGQAEGNNPAEEKLDGAAVDGERVAAEGNHVPDRWVNANAILEPERDGAEEEEDRNVNDSSACAEENQHAEFCGRPDEAEMTSCPPHAE